MYMKRKNKSKRNYSIQQWKAIIQDRNHTIHINRSLLFLRQCVMRGGLSFDVAAPGISARVLLLGKHYSSFATNMQAQYPGSG